jgi:dolichol-phosphate mannosyltransferase
MSLILAIFLSIYVLIVWIASYSIQGWASLLIIFLFFSSVQLACLSIVGEYVGRTYLQTKRRPLYVIKEVHASTRAP